LGHFLWRKPIDELLSNRCRGLREPENIGTMFIAARDVSGV